MLFVLYIGPDIILILFSIGPDKAATAEEATVT